MARAPIEKRAGGRKDWWVGLAGGRADNADRATRRGERDEEDDKGTREKTVAKTRRTGRTRGRGRKPVEDDSRALPSVNVAGAT